MTNRLANESSPYLKQHQDNPVDWYPWGPEALAMAKAENKPILLSVGYSACHWCHVMAHESFENPEIARLMNERFINIKVDREERPDLDQIYQNVAQAITQSGGWPLTVFLTPDLKPYFGGTYYPPEDRWGRPGFPRVLQALSDAYRNDPSAVLENAEKLTLFIREVEGARSKGLGLPTKEQIGEAADALLSQVDWEDGGIGGAPKFPNAMMLDFLWRYGLAFGKDSARDAAVLTLEKMASGGIYDQLGGGFHRYSVDATWSVPHFEKMLYDNGLLLRSYSQVLLSARDGALSPERRELFTRVVEETVDYLMREMRSREGAFFAAQDADSEGEEGKFFVWDPADLKRHLNQREADLFARHYGVNETGNFEHGKTVLFVADGALSSEDRKILECAKKKLLAVRCQRIAPGTDDKVLASWNGLVVSGLAWASQALRASGRSPVADRAWESACRAFEFLRGALSADSDSLRGDRLFSVFKEGRARLNAYLDDYAFLSMAALDLARFEKDPNRADELVAQADSWMHVVLKHFGDASAAGYYFTSDDHEQLIQRPRTVHDQAIPSGTAVTIECLLALSEMDLKGKGRELYAEAERQLSGLFPSIEKRPFGFGELLSAGLLWVSGPMVASGPGIEGAIDHPFVFKKSGETLQLCHRRTCERFSDLGGARELIRRHLIS